MSGDGKIRHLLIQVQTLHTHFASYWYNNNYITESPANLVKYFTFRDFSVSVRSINHIRKKCLNYSYLISKLEETKNRNLLFKCVSLLFLLLRVIQSINSIQK